MTCNCSVGGRKAEIQLLSLTPTVSITKVSPSHFPIECPRHVGSGSCGCPRPSTMIYAFKVSSAFQQVTKMAGNGANCSQCRFGMRLPAPLFPQGYSQILWTHAIVSNVTSAGV